MRVLISTNYKGSWPYIPEMASEFNNKGIICDIYDTLECKLIYNNLQSEKHIINKKLFSILTKVPKIRRLVRKFVNKKFYKEYKGKYDNHTIHYIQLLYSDLEKSITDFAETTVSVAWGSDIYRIKEKDYTKLLSIINNTDYLIVTNEMKEFLQKKFPGKNIGKNTAQLFCVTKSIDKLANLMEQESNELTRKKLGIPNNSLVITFGYNADLFQQHELFINKIDAVINELPDNTFFLFPMTYGSISKNYISIIDRSLKNSKLKYKIFDQFLEEEDNLRIRKVTDITINLQINDALSSSIREHLFANNLVIVGDWLPYNIFEEFGIYYVKTSINDIEKTVIQSVKDFEFHHTKCLKNKEILFENFSFEKNVNSWINFYKSISGK